MGVTPILNIPPSDKSVAVDHSGFLYKQGHGYKTWTYRRFFLQGRSLKYFAEKELKGTVDIKDACVEYCESSECNAPKECFAFKCITPAQTWYLYSTTEHARLIWKSVIEAKAAAIRVATTDAKGNRLLFRRGYLKKEGHLVRSWKKRFFVLDMGLLVYYEKEGEGNRVNPPRPPLGEGEKGRLTLAGATVTKEDGAGRLGVNMNRIYISGKNSEDLLLEAETDMAADAWYRDIQLHIQFAENNPHLVDVDEQDGRLIGEDARGSDRRSSTDGKSGNGRSSMFSKVFG